MTFLILLTMNGPGVLPAAEEGADRSGLPGQVDPHEPGEALDTFEVAPGYRMELVAAEPLVQDPVAMAFDEAGRLFVAEMRGYSEEREGGLGRIKRLEDTDGDGRMDDAVVFADGLRWPTAVFCWDGGVFVGSAPDLLYLKDTDGDGRADRREVVFTGMAPADIERLNVQTLINSLRWGLDNRIYGTPTRGTSIRRTDDAEAEPISMRSRDFSFDPKTMGLRVHTGGGQWGTTFDDWGRMFTCVNYDHNQMVMFENRYIARNPHLRTPSPLRTIGDGGIRADVHRISPPEQWKVLRTRMRVTGAADGPVERGGELHGYVSSAAGLIICRGDAYSGDMDGAAVVGEPANNLVYREALDPDGVALAGRRIDEGHELVASTDIWFRPVAFANAPDGTLWVADMYRQTIEHPWSLPDSIKKHLDLNRGRDRGRIYRIAPDGFEPRSAPDLGGASSAELVALLEHDNAWHRLTAARLLYERQDEEAVEPLRALAGGSDSPRGRMHALYALDGLGVLRSEDVARGLQDEHPRVRENAVRLAEPRANDSDEIRSALHRLADDSDPRVRYQLAFTLGELEGEGRFDPLVRLLRRDASEQWIRMAVMSSLGGAQGRVLARLAQDRPLVETPSGRAVLEELARQVGASGKEEQLVAAVGVIESLGEERADASVAILRGLGEGMGGDRLRERLESSEAGQKSLERIVTRARRLAGDTNRPPDQRIEAIRTLGQGTFGIAEEELPPLLGTGQPAGVERAALDALAGFDDPAVGPILLDAWPRLDPSVQPAAMQALLARPGRTQALLAAVEEGQFPIEDLSTQDVGRLRNHSDEKVAARAKELLTDNTAPSREEVYETYRKELAERTGDASRGKGIFTAACSACHRAEGVGHDLGPNLTAFRSRGEEAMLLNILNPNREVSPDYVNHVLKTRDGETFTGVITAEAANTVTLSPGGGVEQEVPRAEIHSMRITNRSLMPEGLEATIDPQAMADLIAYLMSLE